MLNQYRILSKAIRFSYKVTGTESCISPWIENIVPFGLTKNIVHKHCCFMDRYELVNMTFDKLKGEHMISVTKQGMDYYFKKKAEISSTELVCFWNLVILVLGVIIGKLF